jgi:23S rRNA-/tRNA-specific pseudouridylate synthase
LTLNKNLSVLQSYPTLRDALCDILGISKSFIKKIKISNEILKRKIHAKQSISVPIELLNRSLVNPIYTGKIPKIIFEDRSFLVLDKPADIHCHPLTYLDTNNILSFIRQNGNSQLLNINHLKNEKGLLFRLDKVTSGVLVYIKDEELLKELRHSYSLLVTKKRYLAIVMGKFKNCGTIKLYLKPSGKKGKKIIASNYELPNSKEATQEINLLKYNPDKNLSLLQIDLSSGLRHQIRSSLAYLNHPILGDTLYGGKISSRVWLHSSLYEINAMGFQSFKSAQDIKIEDIVTLF